MNWLNEVVVALERKQPSGEIIVSSGVSPSGVYHVGTLREVMTAEVIARELRNRGRKVRHIHVSDDLDVFRKVPAGIPESYEKYLGMPLCDIPSPDGSNKSYADFYLEDLYEAASALNMDIDIMIANKKYREGYFISAIELALTSIDKIREILQEVSGHKLGEEWSPVQVNEDGYLKNRKFISIDKQTKQITYLDKDGNSQKIHYDKGEVKLNWRIDWPARWSLLGVDAEPFGRDHATKGGSYDTGVEIAKKVFDTEPPLPIPYNFINRTGQTKKMSKSSGDTITSKDLLRILPAEIVWYFMLRYPPSKELFFDEGETLIRLVDEYSGLQAKPDKSEAEKQILELCKQDVSEQTISSVPFSHLVASYQASLKDPEKTLEVIMRTEHKETVKKQDKVIKRELRFIDNWLTLWAPEDVKFELLENVSRQKYNDQQILFFSNLADKIENAPADADGEWFHKAIYEFKEKENLSPKDLFISLYKLIIGKESGPRAGWFLSLLPRDWLISRLRLEK